MMKHTKLPQKFYARDTHAVAKELLGKVLVRQWRGQQIAVRINEVESYVGEDDRASHASRGRTPRTAVMYGPPGRAYVYLIYGMYHCLNVVTGREGYPAAVLIRGAAIESRMNHRLGRGPARGRENPELGLKKPLNGPGKLCRALHITSAQNRLDLARSDTLYIADDGLVVSPRTIAATPRIGVAYAGDHALLPWRYYINFSPFRPLADEGEIKRG